MRKYLTPTLKQSSVDTAEKESKRKYLRCQNMKILIRKSLGQIPSMLMGRFNHKEDNFLAFQTLNNFSEKCNRKISRSDMRIDCSGSY